MINTTENTAVNNVNTPGNTVKKTSGNKTLHKPGNLPGNLA